MTQQEFLAWRASPQGKAVDFTKLPDAKFYYNTFGHFYLSDIDFERSHSPEIEHGWYLKVGDQWYIPIKDVRMPLFALAVFYTGLFFLLQDKGASRMPRG
jgi:hypothetical protein